MIRYGLIIIKYTHNTYLSIYLNYQSDFWTESLKHESS